jgi:hypothetical protein
MPLAPPVPPVLAPALPAVAAPPPEEEPAAEAEPPVGIAVVPPDAELVPAVDEPMPAPFGAVPPVLASLGPGSGFTGLRLQAIAAAPLTANSSTGRQSFERRTRPNIAAGRL